MFNKKIYLKIPYFKYHIFCFTVLKFLIIFMCTHIKHIKFIKLLEFKALHKAYTSKSSLIIDIGGILLLKQLTLVETMTIEDIKLFLKISNTKLKKIISQLSDNNYIKIAKDLVDGRRKLVSISKKGRDYLAKEFEYLVD